MEKITEELLELLYVEGAKVRLKQDTIDNLVANHGREKVEPIIEGVIFKHTPKMGGAMIKHTDGNVYGWSYHEFELVKEGK